MSRRPLALLFVSAIAAMAQPAAPPPADAAPAPTERPRAVSPATAALLAAALPKIGPVKPAERKPDAELPDLRDTDKPRNEIVRLPKYVVREPRPPVFTERELYSDRAFGERLARRYYSEGYLAFNRLARFTPLALYLSSAADNALAQYYMDERLQKMAAFADLTKMLMVSDPVAGAKARDAVQQTFMHTSEFSWSGDQPK